PTPRCRHASLPVSGSVQPDRTCCREWWGKLRIDANAQEIGQIAWPGLEPLRGMTPHDCFRIKSRRVMKEGALGRCPGPARLLPILLRARELAPDVLGAPEDPELCLDHFVAFRLPVEKEPVRPFDGLRCDRWALNWWHCCLRPCRCLIH